jgi:hypothetical protein
MNRIHDITIAILGTLFSAILATCLFLTFSYTTSVSVSVLSLQRDAVCVENRRQRSIASQETWFYSLKVAEDHRKQLGLDKYYQLREKAFAARAQDMERLKKVTCLNK